MRQFIQGSDSDYLDLEKKSQGKCVRFRNQEMPPGVNPQFADIGFEVDIATNKSILWVSEGLQYSGVNREIKNWCKYGNKSFSDFEKLKQWIKQNFTPEFNPVVESIDVNVTVGNLSPNQHRTLTDINAVQAGIHQVQDNTFIDSTLLENELSEKIKGQPQAIKQITKEVVRHCARIKTSRPAVLFSVGPTGVGKTHTAEVLPEAIYNASNGKVKYQFLRLDMTEYQEQHRVSQLLGAPQGYVGHGENSQLIDALHNNPRTIVLFDEIEKAHPAIFKVLMNAMDAGRLSSAGKNGNSYTIDCRNAIFIFTSNIECNSIINEITENDLYEDYNASADICRKSLLNSGIPPEIIGRIGRFLIFKHLDEIDNIEILSLAIADSADEYGLTVLFIAPEVIINLMHIMGTSGYGARTGKYLIDEELGDTFIDAAQHEITKIKISGPPYQWENAV